MQKSSNNVSFEQFGAGIVRLYGLTEDGRRKEIPEATARFGSRIVGEGQYYGAMAADKKISRRIRIPLFARIDEDKAGIFQAVIEDEVYSVIRAQHYYDKRPPVTDLTLSLIRKGV